MIENFFTEEKRIKWLINDAVKEAVDEAVEEALEKKQQENERNEIIHLLELNIPKEKIVEVTGYSIELIEEVLNKKNN